MCESNSTHRVIIPPEIAFQMLQQAGKAFIRECTCRTEEQNCPREEWKVCLLFEHAAAEMLQDASPITIEDALALLHSTYERRSIYQLFFRHHGGQITELCSCCTCCCHPLKRIRKNRSYAEELKSGYLAVTDTQRCSGCGNCIESCFFDARAIYNGHLQLFEAQCFGCGKCIRSCPQDAIHLELRHPEEWARLGVRE